MCQNGQYTCDLPHSSKCAEVQVFFFKTLDVREARGSLNVNPRVHYEVTQ